MPDDAQASGKDPGTPRKGPPPLPHLRKRRSSQLYVSPSEETEAKSQPTPKGPPALPKSNKPSTPEAKKPETAGDIPGPKLAPAPEPSAKAEPKPPAGEVSTGTDEGVSEPVVIPGKPKRKPLLANQLKSLLGKIPRRKRKRPQPETENPENLFPPEEPSVRTGDAPAGWKELAEGELEPLAGEEGGMGLVFEGIDRTLDPRTEVPPAPDIQIRKEMEEAAKKEASKHEEFDAALRKKTVPLTVKPQPQPAQEPPAEEGPPEPPVPKPEGEIGPANRPKGIRSAQPRLSSVLQAKSEIAEPAKSEPAGTKSLPQVRPAETGPKPETVKPDEGLTAKEFKAPRIEKAPPPEAKEQEAFPGVGEAKPKEPLTSLSSQGPARPRKQVSLPKVEMLDKKPQPLLSRRRKAEEEAKAAAEAEAKKQAEEAERRRVEEETRRRVEAEAKRRAEEAARAEALRKEAEAKRAAEEAKLQEEAEVAEREKAKEMPQAPEQPDAPSELAGTTKLPAPSGPIPLSPQVPKVGLPTGPEGVAKPKDVELPASLGDSFAKGTTQPLIPASSGGSFAKGTTQPLRPVDPPKVAKPGPPVAKETGETPDDSKATEKPEAKPTEEVPKPAKPETEETPAAEEKPAPAQAKQSGPPPMPSRREPSTIRTPEERESRRSQETDARERARARLENRRKSLEQAGAAAAAASDPDSKKPEPLLSRRKKGGMEPAVRAKQGERGKMEPAKKLAAPRDLAGDESRQAEKERRKAEVRRRPKKAKTRMSPRMARLIAYPLLILIVGGLALMTYYNLRETRVDGVVALPTDYNIDEVAVVKDFRPEAIVISEDLMQARLPLRQEIAERETIIGQARADLAGRKERIRLLREEIDTANAEIEAIIKGARVESQRLRADTDAQMEAEYDQKFNALKALIQRRADELKLPYEPSSEFESPEIWVNAFRLSLYDAPENIDSGKERMWVEARLSDWKAYEAEWNKRQVELKKQVQEVQASPKSRIDDVNRRIALLNLRIEETQADMAPIQAELQANQEMLDKLVAKDQELDRPHYEMLLSTPDKNKLVTLRSLDKTTGRFSWRDISTKDFPPGNYLLWVKATRGNEVYWSVVPFRLDAYGSTLLQVEEGAFIPLTKILRSASPPSR